MILYLIRKGRLLSQEMTLEYNGSSVLTSGVLASRS